MFHASSTPGPLRTTIIAQKQCKEQGREDSTAMTHQANTKGYSKCEAFNKLVLGENLRHQEHEPPHWANGRHQSVPRFSSLEPRSRVQDLKSHLFTAL